MLVAGVAGVAGVEGGSMEGRLPIEFKDYQKLIDHVDDPIIRGFIVFGVEAGLRFNEIELIRVHDVIDCPIGSSFTVYQNKSKKNRKIFMTRNMREFIESRSDLSSDDFLFASCAGGYPMSLKNYNRRLKGYGAELGVDPARIGSHSCRKTFGRRLLDCGVSIEDVMVYYGHANVLTTMRYIGILDEEMQNAVNVAFN